MRQMNQKPQTRKEAVLGFLVGLLLSGVALVLIFFAQKLSYQVPIADGSEETGMWMMALVSLVMFSLALLYYLFLYGFMFFALFLSALHSLGYGIAIGLLFSLTQAQFLLGFWAWLGLIPIMAGGLFFVKEQWQKHQKRKEPQGFSSSQEESHLEPMS